MDLDLIPRVMKNGGSYPIIPKAPVTAGVLSAKTITPGLRFVRNDTFLSVAKFSTPALLPNSSR